MDGPAPAIKAMATVAIASRVDGKGWTMRASPAADRAAGRRRPR